MSKKTIGELRVETDFNFPEDTTVDKIKQKTAELINLLQDVKYDEISFSHENTPEDFKSVNGEKLRLIALAQTSYEEAVMWAIKAVTI
jgi:hypothetical protein